ncbi:MAG: ribonuclease R [Bacteroidales bacterium]
MSNEKKKKGYGLDKKAVKKQILDVFNNNPKRSLNYKQVSKLMEIYDKPTRKIIMVILEEMAKEKSLVEIHPGKYRIKMQTGHITGKVKITRKGFATIVTSDVEREVIVTWKNLKSALQGDLVKVRLFAKRRDFSYEGEVTEILERRKDRFVGIIERGDNFAFLIPDGKFIPFDIFIPPDKLNGVQDGEKAIVKITKWPTRTRSPEGEVTEVLGMPGENDVEIHSILSEYNLPYCFSDEALKEADDISDDIPNQEIKQREDFRNIPTFTIDPEDAKDFDDALSVRKLKNGLWEVGIHIADVTCYVKEKTTLNEEAEDRATSVYLVDRVVPMLPERLSNKLCSLRPGEDKLCYSVVLNMNDDAEVKDYRITRTIINSNERFTYDGAQSIIESGKGKLSIEILKVHKLAEILRDKRYKHGAFNFERDEIKFHLDDNKKPTGVYFKTMKEANWLIEEFMLLANRKVAEFIGKEQKKHLTFVYRIHDEPHPDKISSFRTFIKNFGYDITPGSGSRKLSASMNHLLKDIKGKAEQHVIENLAIRSMAKAEYSTQNIGHYGLSFDHYTHFTSPIRRYPDMMVHRLLTRYLDNKPSADQQHYEALCEHSSDMEQKAVSAERASVKFKQAEFLKERIGNEYDAIISGVKEWGLFAEIKENGCEGLIPVKSLYDDFYYYDEDNYQLVGKHKGRNFMLGDEVKIKIEKVNVQKKQVDMSLVK